MGGSGASPGFSIGGGAGSGTGMSGGSGGTLPGGTPGPGAGGLGTCCPTSSFSKARVLSARAARGTTVALADDEPVNAFSPSGFQKIAPLPGSRKGYVKLSLNTCPVAFFPRRHRHDETTRCPR